MIDILKNHPFFSDKYIDSCTLLEHQGYCNENYIVVANGTKYVVRKLLRDDINRNLEWKILNMAFHVGITAKLLVFDEVHEFMVFSFLEGEHKQVLNEDDLKLLVEVLHTLHQLKVDAEPINIQIQHKTDEILKSFKVIEKYPKEYALCHNDLNPQNIFFGNGVKLIDFEYAGVNDRYFDLACVCVEFGLDEEQQTYLLDAYFPYTYHVDKFKAYKVIYQALCKEWFDTLA